ncbi:diacylglycerol kinase (ATP) [Caldanaerovirga acetigignens]|uniref:Diacylglycerol kinase (ATP) n=1 Tax=Caldanaerovirga acetigignens TaxID=447595 RepID=A0A1M7FQF1_9FIRM|nr:diacylglycerol kinase [Caldanaerovirga acetigignens]SHM05919.1 diacylglycerol kinase (ATP) [Caldanaerovirga acetigignens]
MKKSRTLFESFIYAISGVIYSLKTQRNMRIHFLAALLVMVLSKYLNLEKIEIVAVAFAATLVIIAEMINTAVETAVDMITDRFHPMARIAKNVAAGAVLIAALNALVVGYMVFSDKLYDLLIGIQSLIFGR